MAASNRRIETISILEGKQCRLTINNRAEQKSKFCVISVLELKDAAKKGVDGLVLCRSELTCDL